MRKDINISTISFDKRKILRCPELNYSRPEREERRAVKQLTEPRAETNKTLLTFLNVCWNLESTSRPPLQLLSTEVADHQTPPHPAYTRTFQAVAHNQFKSHKHLFLTDYTYPRTSLSSSTTSTFIYSPCKIFQNNLRFPSPNLY